MQAAVVVTILLSSLPPCLSVLCVCLQFLPNVSITAELLMSAAEQLPRFTPHSLALTLWSLGALRMRPNKEWMQLVLGHVTDKLL